MTEPPRAIAGIAWEESAWLNAYAGTIEGWAVQLEPEQIAIRHE